MKRSSLIVSTVATLILSSLPLQADDGQDKSKATKPVQGDAAKPGAPNVIPPPSPEQLKVILDDALKLMRTVASTRVNPPNFAALAGRGIVLPDGLSKEVQADAILRIGRARMKLGDRAGARADCQTAFDATAEVAHSPEWRTTLYVDIARAQFEAGERDELRFTLRQALQSARSFGGQPGGIPQPQVVVGSQSDPLVKKADALRKVAEVQTKVGEGAAAGDTLREALETAISIEQPLYQIAALMRIAHSEPADVAKSALAKALEVAMAQKDEYSKAKAIEAVLRAGSGPAISTRHWH